MASTISPSVSSGSLAGPSGYAIGWRVLFLVLSVHPIGFHEYDNL